MTHMLRTLLALGIYFNAWHQTTWRRCFKYTVLSCRCFESCCFPRFKSSIFFFDALYLMELKNPSVFKSYGLCSQW